MTNKDHLLNVRISKSTYKKIRKKAMKSRQSMSNLVRNIINDGIDIIESISSDVFSDKEEKGGGFYYSAISKEATDCSLCKKKIKKGENVIIEESLNGKKNIICQKCKK